MNGVTTIGEDPLPVGGALSWPAAPNPVKRPGRTACDRRDPHVLFASSEVFPLAKTGGLADVSAALPATLAALGVDIRLILPGYTEALERACGKGKPIPLGNVQGLGETSLVPALAPDTGLPLWLVDCPPLFQRRGGLYLDEDGREWPDNALRFALFCHAVARVARGAAGTGWQPELVHLNDWQLGLVPALLAARPGLRPASILTIHNLAFQGVFPVGVFPRLGLPSDWFTAEGVEFYGKVSFLKAGILYADRLTTVSTGYAREILTPEFGCGLDGLLRTRAHDLVGILNGIDMDGWTPNDRTTVPYPYGVHDLSGKKRCKRGLQHELGLRPDPDAPLIAFVSRLTEQKMADFLPQIGSVIARQRAQMIVCGRGDRSIEHALRRWQTEFPNSVAVHVGYDEALARRTLAGADMLAAPARFEPCGLTQMYAMRFGAVPIVQAVGGLADTVIGHDEETRDAATGVAFKDATAAALADAIERACGLYRDPTAWRALQRRIMMQDFGWKRPAERYRSLYGELCRDPSCAAGDGEDLGRAEECAAGT